MRALVIGGCGFIGSHIVDSLSAQGARIRVLDRQPERFRAKLSGVEYLFGSFLERMTLAEALSGVDIVFHAVSTTFPGTADLDPASDVSENLCGTLGLLELMREMGISRIVYLSSGGTVYGIPDICPVPEHHPLRPIGSYGIVKAAVEQYLRVYERRYGLSPVIVRASNPYGPRQAHSGVQGVVATFLGSVASGEPIEVWGDGSVVRDYIDVREVAGFCARAAASDVAGAFNVGSGQGTSLLELIGIIHEVTGLEQKTVFKIARPVDVPISVLDVTRAQQHLGWTPSVKLSQGIADTWAWMQSSADQ